MADELLPYYEKELAFIRQLGAEFADRHPKVAGHLKISEQSIEDPHVSRLIEAFAYLNARIQYKLDDDFPELSDAMLGVLFPHYQRPLPSMSIIQLQPAAELDSIFALSRDAIVESQPVHGQTCKFTTCYPVDILPVSVSTATMAGLPFVAPGSNDVQGAASVIRICLKTNSSEVSFAALRPQKLRFYLKGLSQHVNPLYQLLHKDCLNVVLAKSEDDTRPVFLGRDAIKPVGFREDEGLLPYPAASFIGYRLVTEYFAYPEKFLFIDIEGLADAMPGDAGGEINLFIYLANSSVELEHNINETTFALHCTPVINLFKQVAEPIALDHTQHEYLVVPDSRHPEGMEIYSIDEVKTSSSDGDIISHYPIYGANHDSIDSDYHAYWHCSRRSSSLGNFNKDDGADVFISMVDLHFNPDHSDDRTLEIDLTCTNRDLPAQLPFGKDQPKFHFADAAPPVKTIKCLMQPTATVRPPLRDYARWRLISHLNLNNLSLTGTGDPTAALKEILRLYDFKDSSTTRAIIQSITGINTAAVSAPITINHKTAICRGTEIYLEIDESLLAGHSPYLLANVLERFFALYCSINSFTRVIATLKGKEGILKRCPPRIGEKVLL
ncbi:MAG: type VI secretion system baseplate subunit TssF [Gammaproteobacteria bacterium]|nr:type VI secretion system baseplate subunit TssF [Gammaproteobacteria bacterium]